MVHDIQNKSKPCFGQPFSEDVVHAVLLGEAVPLTLVVDMSASV